MFGFVYLYVGEEVIVVGMCVYFNDNDSIMSIYCGYGYCIVKGGDLDGMMVELFGKVIGLGKGKGGFMYIVDLDKGILGVNGIVGGGFLFVCGFVLIVKYKKIKDVSVCFFGDGVGNEGMFYEGINLVVIWKLFVVFVVENNGYGEVILFFYVLSCSMIVDCVVVYNILGVWVDGKDVMVVYEVVVEVI